MKWRCKIFGHKWEPEGAEYYQQYWCVRCDHHGYTDGSLRERAALRLWIWQRRIEQLVRALKQWLKCSECGCRFGKHDYEQFDHLPF